MLWVPASVADEHLAQLPRGVDVVRLPPALPLVEDLGGGDVLVASNPVAVAALSRIRGLRVVQTLSAGVDWIVEHVPPGVILCDAAGVHDTAVAEWCLAAILAHLRHLPRYLEQQRRHQWERPTAEVAGDELWGRTVLIVGYGSIGRALARRLHPFRVRLCPVARRARPGVLGPEALSHVLPHADVVVVLVPLTPQTRRMVDARFLARMRDNALLVNAARGGVVDTAALTAEVCAGRLRAALDVVDPEPLPPDHPLWDAPGVLLTPHLAGSTVGFRRRAWALVATQLRRLQRNLPLANVVVFGY